ncbi:minor capsid protein (plasmid) [Rhizobium lusitanum]|uniref:phage minor head protein n=1 Tax=Rhizobium lusitanum TaxID=293958 RepID=UPI001613110E|nr:phage minor head protein [Rhizobium lusitanum]QND45209.1 minor capsid protein [Rhizobium lusitanum]
MTEAIIKPLAPAEAIRALRSRGQRLDPSFSWQDAFGDEHASMFTVAKSAGFDILQDIHDGLLNALQNGTTFRDFAKDLTPVLQAKGWWGRQIVTDPLTGDKVVAQLGSARRLQTIFDTNMRVSYAAGHWANFQRNKRARPFLRYVAILDERTRPSHRARHNLCLPVDDPYWDSWAPPCGWNCRCTLQSLSQRDVDQMRDVLKFEPPADTFRNFVNKRTGEIIRVPDGIDPGWGHNPGKTGHQALPAAEKLITAPPELAAAYDTVPDWLLKPSAKEFADWFDQASEGGRSDPSMVVAGALNRDVLDSLAERSITPDSGAITLTQSTVGHMLRDFKAGNNAGASAGMLRRLPEILANPQAVLRDNRNGALIYVFDPGDGRSGKIVVRMDFAEKARPPGGKPATIITNSIRTAGVVDTHQFAASFYDLLWGNCDRQGGTPLSP